MSETIERILEKCPDCQKPAVSQWLETNLSKTNPFDGLPVFLVVDDMLYEKTGNTPDRNMPECKPMTSKENSGWKATAQGFFLAAFLLALGFAVPGRADGGSFFGSTASSPFRGYCPAKTTHHT